MYDWWYAKENDNDGCGMDNLLLGAGVLFLIGISLIAMAVIISV